MMNSLIVVLAASGLVAGVANTPSQVRSADALPVKLVKSSASTGKDAVGSCFIDARTGGKLGATAKSLKTSKCAQMFQAGAGAGAGAGTGAGAGVATGVLAGVGAGAAAGAIAGTIVKNGSSNG